MSILKSKLALVCVLIVLLLSVHSVFAVGMEGMSAIHFGAGTMMPMGDFKHNRDIGTGYALDFGYSQAMGSKILDFSVGFLLPKTNVKDLVFFEFPISANIIFPLAAESSTTPYFGLGPSFLVHLVDYKNDVVSYSYFQGHIGFDLVAGILFAPQMWSDTYIDLKARYSHFVHLRTRDVQNIDLLLGIAFNI